MLGLGLGLNPRRVPHTPSANLDADTLALSLRMAAAGSAPTADHKTHIDSLIVGLKAADLWADFDGFYVLLGPDAHALRNWRSDAFNLTKLGDVTISATEGAQADGVAGSCLGTGFVPSVAGGLFQKDSAHLALWWKSAGPDLNYGAGGSTTQCRMRDGSNRLTFRMNDGTSSNSASNSVVDASGLTVFQREGATVKRAYRNGDATPLFDGTVSSTSLAAGELFLLANSPGNVPTADKLLFASMGRHLSPAKQAAMKTHVEAYLIAMGASL